MSEIKYYTNISDDVINYVPKLHPFIDSVFEDKSNFPSASSKDFIDVDNDFLIGDSNGFLMKTDFVFVAMEQFTEVAKYFKSTCKSLISLDGYYCSWKEGSVNYNNFWKKETQRRRKGMTALCKLPRNKIEQYNKAKTEEERKGLCEPLHITGDHYNYLNYGRIMRVPNNEERKELDRQGKFKVQKIMAFPNPWDGDYWNFKIDFFIAANSLHLTKAKARRKGYSNKRGSQSANTINLNRDVSILLIAYDIGYLTDSGATADMLKRNLDWYENKTFWVRGYLKEKIDDIELGYKEEKQGNKKYGFRSKALSVTCFNNPDCAIGKDSIETDFEEAGKNPLLKETLATTMSTAEAGETQVGTIRIYGTGGTKGANWQDFSDIFYNPFGFGMMAFENVWDIASRHNVCGFFHPQILNYEPHLDKDGNSFLVKSFYIDLEKKKHAATYKTVDDYNIYVGQRANSPSEAFSSGSENIFSSIELNEHIKFIKANNDKSYFKDGQFFQPNSGVIQFKSNETLIAENYNDIHPFIENVPFVSKDDVRGCWRIFHEPKRFDGVIPDNLYYQVIDPIGKDKTVKEVSIKNSLNAIYIFAYPNNLGIPSDIILAIFVGRNNTQEDASREVKNGCLYYNAKTLAETDRGTVVADFKRWDCKHLLLPNPLSVVSGKINSNAPTEYGITVGTGERASEFYIGLKNWLYTPVSNDDQGNLKYRLHYIYDLPTLLEFQTFNSKGNFDRLSALRLMPIQRLAYITKKQESSIPQSKGTFLSQLGLYKN